jgi:hypothetical protein
MSQSLRVVKRFRIRELTLASPPKNSRIPPAATAAPNVHPQKQSSPPSRSGTGGTTTLNPFLPHKNLESGRWAPPRYSLRRQADLIKHARASGTLHLLPPGPKMTLAQLELAAAAVPTTTTTTTATSSSSAAAAALGESHVEEVVVVGKEEAEADEAVVVGGGSGSVSLRRRKEGEVQEREREEGPGPGPGLGLGPGQEGGQEAVEEKEEEGEAQAHTQGEGEVLQAPEPTSLGDAQAQAQARAQADWTIAVEWSGTVRERSVAGADVGNRLYAGKKRMFKGHKWERTRERRVGRTEMLLRDMDKRIQRFKGVRFRLPPLSPPLFSQSPSFLLTAFFPFSFLRLFF